ncbi:MAG TPA: glycoside hydrolase domain-containing protein [Thermoanaerobaculia bacterium]|nr:glycoside hydrolase domain-containing protein [Thermoanaerobaculia bacterium]
MTTINGCDSSSACTSDAITCLKQKGIQFVGRYYSRTTHIAGKKLTASEAQLVSAAGLDLVAVYEDGPTAYSYFSADRGTADANGALEQAADVGQPEGSAIYFSVDYDASDSEIAANIHAYFQAVAAAIGSKYRIGIYGSGSACTAMMKAGFAQLAWLSQSTGFSGTKTFTNWVIKQGAEGAICGLNSDADVAQGDYGAFRVSAT